MSTECSSSSTSSSAAPAATLTTDAGCASNSPINGTNYVSLIAGIFKYYCLRDFVGNDLLGVILPSFEACIKACASWNQKLGSNGDNVTPCTAVAFVPSWYNARGQAAGAKAVGDCFLKKNVTSGAQLADSAGLVTDIAIKQ